jgi:hypothetical protein
LTNTLSQLPRRQFRSPTCIEPTRHTAASRRGGPPPNRCLGVGYERCDLALSQLRGRLQGDALGYMRGSICATMPAAKRQCHSRPCNNQSRFPASLCLNYPTHQIRKRSSGHQARRLDRSLSLAWMFRKSSGFPGFGSSPAVNIRRPGNFHRM